MHKVFEEVQKGTSLPLLNIIDVVALHVKQEECKVMLFDTVAIHAKAALLQAI